MFLVGCFQCLLFRRQVGALRIKHQIKLKIAIRLPVTQRVQFFQCGQAGIEGSLAALFINIVFQITGQRGGNDDLVGGKELGLLLVTLLLQDNQVAAVDDGNVHCSGAANQILEMRVHFRRAAG